MTNTQKAMFDKIKYSLSSTARQLQLSRVKGRNCYSSHHRQQGVVLVVVLIFLLALSTLAIFSARNVTFGERQARNEVEFQVARQAAEAALRDAEADLSMGGGSTPSTAVCPARVNSFRTGFTDSMIGSVSPTEFTNTCLQGQCGADIDRYTVGWAAATASATAGTINRGEPWWPVVNGGSWNNGFSSKPSRGASGNTNCTTFVGGVSLGVFTGRPPFAGVSRQPEYLIELIQAYQDVPAGGSPLQYQCQVPIQIIDSSGNPVPLVLRSADETGGVSTVARTKNQECTMFRITARGFGRATRGTNDTPATEVVLQSYFSIL